MSCELTFLLGRAATGKSERIVSALKAHQQAGRRAILIVPGQYTYESERMLAETLGGLLGIQVFSFDRLCERVLQLHGQTRPFLNAQGYRMVIRRAIDKKRDELKVFRLAGEQSGFAGDAQTIFQDFKRAGLTPDALDALIVRLPEDSPLTEKLGDLSLIYRETEDYLQERYLSTDDAVKAATKLLPSSFVAGLPVYIDGLDRPNRQRYGLIEAMLGCCPSVTVSLRVDCGSSPDDELFEPDRRVLWTLKRMGERLGATMREEQLFRQSGTCDPLMRHIERNLFAYPANIYSKDAKNLTIFGASNRRAEAEALAGAIQSYARKGVRYRDMACAVSDLDAYAAVIRRACERRRIPIFLDRKRPLTGHAAIDAVLSAVRFVSNSNPPAELLKFIKSGYTDCMQDDAEELDLYLRRTGLRGGALLKPFKRADPPEGAERARACVSDALNALSKGLARATVSEQVRALYAFLQQIDLQKRLETRADELGKRGRIAEMEEHAQVWNLLMELLDQMDAILDERKVGRKGFLSLLEEGLGGGSVGIVPGTVDQGLVGDIVRTRSGTVKVLFLVGANEGMLPRPQQNDGLIDDRELLELRSQGTELSPVTAELSAYDRLDLYTAISKTTGSLYVSYAYGDAGGELAPSPVVDRLRTLCPNCTIKSDIETTDVLPDCTAQALTLVAATCGGFATTGS
jgi:ATP-dependent helicase/nuclease subunit B